MNGYCDSCGKLIMNDASVVFLKNGKIVTTLCLECDEEKDESKDGDILHTTTENTTGAAGDKL